MIDRSIRTMEGGEDDSSEPGKRTPDFPLGMRGIRVDMYTNDAEERVEEQEPENPAECERLPHDLETLIAGGITVCNELGILLD